MQLFGRVWSVQIDRLKLGQVDMSFSIVKSTKPEPNTCELKIFNLSETTRASLEGSPLVQIPQKGKGPAKFQHQAIPVRIEAGYDIVDSLIWSGDLRTVESEHDHADWVTTIGTGDGEQAYWRSRANLSFGPGTPMVTVMTALVRALGLGPGNLAMYTGLIAANGSLATMSANGIVLSGSAAEMLTHLARSVGLEWSIQDGAIQFTVAGKPRVGLAVLLSKETGLIGSPSIDQEAMLKAKMLMVPGVQPGTVLVLKSERMTGTFRIVRATYEGDSSGQPWYIEVHAKRM